MATYKAVMRPALEYASSVWSPIASSTSINKLQVMQNAALRTATGCTQDTNIQHLHDETLTLPIHEHLQLHASQYKQKTHSHRPPHSHYNRHKNKHAPYTGVSLAAGGIAAYIHYSVGYFFPLSKHIKRRYFQEVLIYLLISTRERTSKVFCTCTTV